MKKAVIIYHSKTGTTAAYAEEIGYYLRSKGLKVTVCSIFDFNPKMLKGVDYILLGCWTSGYLVFNQHPEKIWVDFAKNLPPIPTAKIALFTTYKIMTGSMFNRMKEHLHEEFNFQTVGLRSRNGKLIGNNALDLNCLIE